MLKKNSQNLFGRGEGKLIIMSYEKPLPMRLDRWLVSVRTEQSRTRIQKFINDGLVKVNGVNGFAKTPLKTGDKIELWLPPPEPLVYLKPQKMDLNILFEDKHIIVINKPAGITVHPGPGNKDRTLVNGLLYHCSDLPGIGGKLRPGIVHRLDKDTTGCLVIAKSQEALVKLQLQIQKRIAKRSYLGIVHGVPEGTEGNIKGFIGRHPKDRKKYAVVQPEDGKYACTNWELIERLGDYSLISFQLDTGRTHQIRVHCAHLGNPILGDQTYSRCKKLPINIPGQLLHAVKLELLHPYNQSKMIFDAPLPEIFEKSLMFLRNK